MSDWALEWVWQQVVGDGGHAAQGGTSKMAAGKVKPQDAIIPALQ